MLINHITQFDKADEQRGSILTKNFVLNEKFESNISMSSHAMNSFLNDFDLNRKSNIKPSLLGADNEESIFNLESRRNSTSKKKPSKLGATSKNYYINKNAK